MGSPERANRPHREGEERPNYHLAVRFPGEREAKRAYRQAQDTIFRADCDLSTYRFLLDRDWHVAALGEVPSPELDQQLRVILADGEPAELPLTVLAQLTQRRRHASRLGPWVEGHYGRKERP